jgi:nicotinamidase-related amidase
VSALILIDLQHGLCLPGGVGSAGLAEQVEQRGTLAAATALLEAFRRSGEPVFHIRLGFEPGFLNRTNRTARFDSHEEAGRFVLGSPDTEFAPAVAPGPGELVLTKGSVGAFTSTALAAQLAALKISEVYLAGVATHLAVESTAREGADRGLAVNVVADACAGPPELHDWSLTKVLPAFATIIDVATAVSGR